VVPSVMLRSFAGHSLTGLKSSRRRSIHRRSLLTFQTASMPAMRSRSVRTSWS
ncbi:hypothetical protein Pmar_PMAR026139, partial [Perkinsus marinus ATCC 50983]